MVRRGPNDFAIAVDGERLTQRIEPEWLIDYFPDRVEDRSGVEWNRQSERVETVNSLVYDGIVIEESRGGERTSGRRATAGFKSDGSRD